MAKYIPLIICLCFLTNTVANATGCISSGIDSDLCETREILFETEDGILLKEKTEELASPVKIYEYLKNKSQYSPYHGARSNSINTFLGLRGNDVDLASALIAMFRSQGIKSRYKVGNIKILKSQLANWLGVLDEELAVSILRDQGVQNVMTDTGDPSLVAFEHVWVEALLDYTNYRGGNQISSTTCAAVSDSCKWISLDPSFKQYTYADTYKHLLKTFSFDYDAYYHAENPSHANYVAGLKHKNPLEIYEEEAIKYLRSTGNQGVSLEDILDEGEVIKSEAGILPSSLPYHVISGTTKTYTSVDDYDSDPGNVYDWSKYLRATLNHASCDYDTGIGPSLTVLVPVTELSTKKLTATVFNNGSENVFGYRLDGKVIGNTVTVIQSGGEILCGDKPHSFTAGESSMKLRLEMDAEPYRTSPLRVEYTDLILGGYYLIATGGETSNWSQVERAYNELLQADEEYPIVYNASDLDCDISSGANCIPYVDDNSNGFDISDTPLINHLEAQDKLTGGLLYIAQSLYYTRFREESARYSRLRSVISPVSAYLGVVSTVDTVEYLGDVPFAVTPGGLLIDLKGVIINGTWEIEQEERYSSEAFKFLGHLASSLEHEVWQELTGYDAISTVRGVQIALGQGSSLIDISSRSDYLSSLVDLGAKSSVPSGFTQNSYDLFGKNLYAWEYDESNDLDGGNESTAGFYLFRNELNTLSLEDDRSNLYSLSASDANQINNTLSTYYDIKTDFENQQEEISNKKIEELGGHFRIGGLSQKRVHVYSAAIINNGVIIPDSISIDKLVCENNPNHPTNYSYVGCTGFYDIRFSLESFVNIPDGDYDIIIYYEILHPEGSPTWTNRVSLTEQFSIIDNKVQGAEQTHFYYDVTNLCPISSSVFVRENTPNLQATIVRNLHYISEPGGSCFPFGSSEAFKVYMEVAPIYYSTNTITEVKVDIGILANSSVFITSNNGRIDDVYIPDIDTSNLECNGQNYTDLPESLLQELEDCFNEFYLTEQDFFDFVDSNMGFDPSEHSYMSFIAPLTSHDPEFIVNNIRDMVFSHPDGEKEIIVPEYMPSGHNFIFNTYFRNVYNSDGDLKDSSYNISNYSSRIPLTAGGGYVTAEQVIDPAESPDDFDNEVFNDERTVAVASNDLVRTPSTSDPVSTVTGNMYHDETDIQIKGRGLHYTLTRTYNSDNADKDIGFGYGWSHSYGMTLRSEDAGKNPNDDTADENNDDISSSITYTDERGGEHTYILNTDGTTPRTVIENPPGEFDTLELNTNAGQHTITFRNGTKYVFEETNGSLDMNPDTEARLIYIEDAYKNRLSLNYNATTDLLESITDNLGVSGRGLTFSYTGNRISQISDWSGRIWDYNYDTDGNLQYYTNPRSDQMEYTYHTDHYLNQIIQPEDRDGQKKSMAFGYYENNRAYNYIDTLGQEESLSYDLFRKKTRITDPRGFISEHLYNEQGALIRLTEKDNGIMLFENNSDGLRYSKTDALGYETQYSYQDDGSDEDETSSSNNFGLVSKETDPLGRYILYQYNTALYDQPTITTDKLGNDFTREYYTTTGGNGVKGKLKSVKADLNDVDDELLEEYQYYSDIAQNNFGQIKKRIEYIDPDDSSRQRITDFQYEANGINLSEVTVTGATSGTDPIMTTFSYDNLGRLETQTLFRRTSATDNTPLSLVTSYEYDELDRVTRVTNPRKDISETIYDANGQVSQENIYYQTSVLKEHCAHEVINNLDYQKCVVASHDYDAADRRTSTTDILGNTTYFQYDEVGNVIKQTDANGNVIQYEYDAMNRRSAMINANGYKTLFKYDLAGRLINTIDANGNITINHYDGLGRLTSVVTEEGRTTKFQYDANGNQTHMIDANAVADPTRENSEGATVFTKYDELNRPIEVQDALDQITITTYDLLGNITSITDAEGQMTKFIYDDLGRLVETVDPIEETGTDKTDQITLYDEVGNVLQATDRSGRTVTSTYDVLNRLTQSTYSNGTEDIVYSYHYDDFGDLISISNPTVSYTYSFTDRHEMSSKTDNRLNKTLSWTYDNVGNMVTKTDYQGDVTNFQYDSTNRLVAMQNPAFLQVNYHYDPAGRLTDRILSNGSKSHYTYDDDNRLKVLSNYGADGNVLESYTYDYDEVGNIDNIIDSVSGETIVYQYDPLYRLSSVDSNNNTKDESFTYDKVGNRRTHTIDNTTYYYCYHKNLVDCNDTIDHAPKGNRLHAVYTGSLGGTLYRSFIYDDAGRIIQKRDGGGNAVYAVLYNALGKASQISNGSSADSFAYDPNEYRIVKNSEYYHLEGEHLEATYCDNGTLKNKYLRGVLIDELVNGFEYHSADETDWSNVNFHHDNINSVTQLSDQNGANVQSYQYSAFGQLLNSPTHSNEMTYTGRQYDANTGLYYYRARYYDAELGRFISEDPLGFEAGINFYAYVNNNPIMFNDPSGEIDLVFSPGNPNPRVENFGGKFSPVTTFLDIGGNQLPASMQAIKQTFHTPINRINSESFSTNFINSSINFAMNNTLIGKQGSPELSSFSVAKHAFNYLYNGINSNSGITQVINQGMGGGSLDFKQSLNPADLFTFNGELQTHDSLGNSAFAASLTQLGFSELSIRGGSQIQALIQTHRLDMPGDQPALGAGINFNFTKPSLFNTSPSNQFFSSPAAGNGGFVLYPNKPNTNMMRAVYSK